MERLDNTPAARAAATLHMSHPSTGGPSPASQHKRSGVMRGLHALRYSCNGILTTLRTESAFRQEACAALVLLPLAGFVPVSTAEHVLLAVSVLLVLLVELLNSAIEAVVDRISLEQHDLSGRAKDCGSAAVLVSLLIWAVTWGTICAPLVWHGFAGHR